MVDIIQNLKQIKKTNKLADSMLVISNRLLPFISMNLSHLRWELIHDPPIKLLTHFATFAHLFRSVLDTDVFTTREEVVKFFTDLCNIKKGKFESIISNCMDFKYDHTDIYNNLEHVEEFMKTIHLIFEKASELDFIPNRQTGTTVVGEVEEKKTKFSFLQK